MIEYTTHYAPETDITFITKDYYNGMGDAVKTEVISFYFGEPDKEETVRHIENASLTADYDNV